MNKRIKPERVISHMCRPAGILFQINDPVNVVIFFMLIKHRRKISHLSDLLTGVVY